MAKELDTTVEALRTRPLDAGPYTFVAADALMFEVRGAGPPVVAGWVDLIEGLTAWALFRVYPWREDGGLRHRSSRPCVTEAMTHTMAKR